MRRPPAAAIPGIRSHFAVNDADTIYQKQPTVEPVVGGLPVPAGAAGASYISPRMRARMAELGLNATPTSPAFAGSGATRGRVTVEDFEQFLAQASSEHHHDARPRTMRMAVADAMRRGPGRGRYATVGKLLSCRIDRHARNNRKKANPKPGPALYAIRALAIALSENTAMAAGRLVGDTHRSPMRSIDIGFAVEAETTAC